MYNIGKMEKEYDFLIVGSGLAGCVFAHQATKRGKRCLVVERRDHVGGNIAQEDINGITVHKYGAHIFRTNDKWIWDYLNCFSEFNHFVNSPIANYNGEIYNLPFNMNTFNRLFGCNTPKEAKKAIDDTKIFCENPKNLEEWAKNCVGTVIYEKLIKEYTEKQWGKKCSELPISIMRRIPLRFTYDNNYFDCEYQGIPKSGYNSIIEQMLDGCDVLLSTDYKTIKNNLKARRIVYTGSLDEKYDYCFGALEWRSLRFEHEFLQTEDFQGVAVQNFTGKEEHTRIIEHKHFLFGKQPHTIITREFPQKWDITKEKYYPINDEKNEFIQKKYEEKAASDGIIVLGRLAEYKYYDMQDTIKRAIDVSVKVLGSEMNGE